MRWETGLFFESKLTLGTRYPHYKIQFPFSLNFFSKGFTLQLPTIHQNYHIMIASFIQTLFINLNKDNSKINVFLFHAVLLQILFHFLLSV